jgi:RimJ/RimL family protein N-acetyltransferase
VIELREVEQADLEVFYEHQADAGASAMALFPSRDREAHFDHWRRSLARPDGIARTVLVDRSVAGNVVSWIAEGRRLLGYWIGREFWGRGVATTALRLFVDEVAERPLFAFVAKSNVASVRVLEKAGFVRANHQPEAGEDGIEEWLFALY